MSYQDYLPANWIRNRKNEEHPLISLRKEVDSLFDDFGNGFFGGGNEVSVRSNVSETDKEFCVTAELPGMTEAVVKDGVLTVTIPKPPEAVENTKKIKVAHAK